MNLENRASDPTNKAELAFHEKPADTLESIQLEAALQEQCLQKYKAME